MCIYLEFVGGYKELFLKPIMSIIPYSVQWLPTSTSSLIFSYFEENMNHRKFQNHNLRKPLAFSIILDQSSKKQDLCIQILFHFIPSELFSPVSYLQLAHTVSYCWNTLCSALFMHYHI